MQPTHATSDMRFAARRLGTDRLAGSYAWRSLLASGARLAGGSDFPVEPVNPFFGIHAAVTRRDRNGEPLDGWRPEQRLTLDEAIRLFTIDAAYAAFEEDLKGTIEPGKLADFILLDRDPYAIRPEELHAVLVETTVVGGSVVFRRDGNVDSARVASRAGDGNIATVLIGGS